ncbi:YkoF family thiamine/hydroxymethylpyrimidine-binding protein [Pseudoalteromonas 'SMAR']|uniref:YkoF family thiamine/hydroxymethylpyrimidine-binding protein n=1 Tax=Pseudoalteromonas 'SMAR' TaxID=3416908 RepID=UPI003AF29B5E
MKVSVEISKYPLHQDYIPYIQGFIDRLNQHEQIKVNTNVMSTQIFGDYDVVTDIINQEMKRSFAAYGKCIFVCKYIAGDLSQRQGDID